MKLLYLVGLCIICELSFGQFDLDNFQGVQSTGVIPEAFTKNSSQKFLEARTKQRNENLDDAFLIETNFFLDELLLSGKITFNDPISIYVEDLAEELLENDKSLLDSLQFYTLKSNVPNAFSTDQGIILVTTGLVARCENKAMLAFVLAHEIAHFTEKHVRKSHLHTRELNNENVHSEFDYDLVVNQISQYSKSNELAADKLGSEIYLNAGFPLIGIEKALKMLERSSQTIFDETFDHNMFNLEGFQFELNDSLFLNKQILIKKNDSSSTHPGIEQRLAKFDFNSLDVIKLEEESRFNDVRELALFETVNIYNQQADFFNCLQLISTLQQRRPENKFLIFSKTHALYAIAMHKSMKTPLSSFESKNFEGILTNNLAKLMIDAQTESVLNLAYGHVLKIKKTDSTILSNLPYQEHLEIEMSKNYSKFDHLLEIIDSTKNKSINAYFNQGLLQIDDRPTFLESISNYERDSDSVYILKYFRKNRECIYRNKSKHDNVVYLDPNYERLGLERKGKFYLKSERDKIVFNSRMQDMVTELDEGGEVICPLEIKLGEVDKFNDFSLIKSWLTDRIWSNSSHIINSQQRYINIHPKYKDATHVVLSGVSSYKTRTKVRDNPWDHYYLAPYFLVNSLIIRNKFEIYLISLNLQSGEVEASMFKSVKFKGSPVTLDFHVYDFLDRLYEKDIIYNDMLLIND
ncbi:MAG: hypothetical protein ACI857_001859, partial [Arenicella sp.]|jgi:hypothetical protein